MTDTETTIRAPQFVDAASRTTVEPLEWPIEFEGVVYREITIRRPSSADVRNWEKRVREANDRGESIEDIPLPVFDAPDAVIQMLDPDDDDRLGEVAKRFLPRRFQVEASPIPSSADSTSPKPPES